MALLLRLMLSGVVGLVTAHDWVPHFRRQLLLWYDQCSFSDNKISKSTWSFCQSVSILNCQYSSCWNVWFPTQFLFRWTNLGLSLYHAGTLSLAKDWDTLSWWGLGSMFMSWTCAKKNVCCSSWIVFRLKIEYPTKLIKYWSQGVTFVWSLLKYIILGLCKSMAMASQQTTIDI